MTDRKISELNSTQSVGYDDLLAVVRQGETMNVAHLDFLKQIKEQLSAVEDYEVLNGCLVTVNDPEDNAINIASGKVIINGLVVSVSEQLDETLSDADGTDDRYDVVCVDTDGLISVITGTADSSPVVPSLTSDVCPIATVFRPSGNNTVSDSNLYDGRFFRNKPFVVTDNNYEEEHSEYSGGNDWWNKKTLVVPPFVCRKLLTVTADYSVYCIDIRNDTGSYDDEALKIENNGVNINTSYIHYYQKNYDTGWISFSSGNVLEYLTSDDVDFEQFNTFKLYLRENSHYHNSEIVTTNNHFGVRGE